MFNSVQDVSNSMDRLVFSLLMFGIAAGVALFFYVIRLFVVYAVIKKLHERFSHIYNEHYPMDQQPTFFCAVNSGLLMMELRRCEEIKRDSEIYRLVNIDRVISIMGIAVLLSILVMMVFLKYFIF